MSEKSITPAEIMRMALRDPQMNAVHYAMKHIVYDTAAVQKACEAATNAAYETYLTQTH